MGLRMFFHVSDHIGADRNNFFVSAVSNFLKRLTNQSRSEVFALVFGVHFGVDQVNFVVIDHVVHQPDARRIQENFKAVVIAIVHYLCAHDVNLSSYGY